MIAKVKTLAKQQKQKTEQHSESVDLLSGFKAKSITLSLMTLEEVEKYNRPGHEILYVLPARSAVDLARAMRLAFQLSADNQVHIVKKGPHSVKKLLSYLQRRLNDPVFRRRTAARRLMERNNQYAVIKTRLAEKIQIEIQIGPKKTHVLTIEQENPEGYPVDVTYYTDSNPKRRAATRIDRKNNGSGGPPGDDDKLLNDALDDNLLIDALTTADSQMMNGIHKESIKWEEEGFFHTRRIKDNHLLVCLYFYVYVNKLYNSSDFYFGQRKQFYQFFITDSLKDFSFTSERYFLHCIDSLERLPCSFSDYLKPDKRTEFTTQNGDFNIHFWYSIYERAAACFEKVLPVAL